MYGNHTNAVADALIPTMVSHPADTYVIVHPNNVSMPIFGKVTPYLVHCRRWMMRMQRKTL